MLKQTEISSFCPLNNHLFCKLMHKKYFLQLWYGKYLISQNFLFKFSDQLWFEIDFKKLVIFNSFGNVIRFLKVSVQSFFNACWFDLLLKTRFDWRCQPTNKYSKIKFMCYIEKTCWKLILTSASTSNNPQPLNLVIHFWPQCNWQKLYTIDCKQLQTIF